MSILRFLLLEDNPLDAKVVQAMLLDGGIDYELQRVDTRTDFVTALETDEFDLILADYALPDFHGIDALEIARKLCPETPFIFVSASLGEELAIETLKRGATDYVLKQRLGRLVPCVQRALREAKERYKLKQAELMLVEQNRLLELIASGQPLDKCLAAMCASMSQLNPRARACFLLTDAQRLRFKNSITPDFPPSFGQGLKDAPINELAICTCGTAVYRGKPVTCADIANDDRWSQDWGDLCVAHGVLACHSVPVLSVDSLPFGSLMLCFDEARMPTDWERQLADFGTQVASIVFERDRSNLALRQHEARLHAVAANLPNGAAFILDRDLRYLVAEGNALQGAGMTSEDLVGKTLWEALDPTLATRYELHFRQALSGEPFSLEHCSHERYYISHGTPLRNDRGEVDAVLAVSYDITDRKRAEQALCESEEQSRNILESITDAFFALDENWLFTYVNKTAETLLNRTPGDLIGKNFWEEFPGLNGSEFEQLHRRVMSDRVAGSLTAFYPDHDRWYEVRTYPAANGITIYFRNVTARIQAEAALRQTSAELERQLQKFNAVMSAVPDFIYIFDLSGRFIDVNKPLLDLWQKTFDEAVGKNFFELGYPEDLAVKLQNQIQQVIQTRQPLKDETPYTSAFGTRAYEYILVPIFDVDGAVEMVAGVTRDITERKQAEAEREKLLQQEQAARETAEQANCIKDEFLAVLSHELRSPLNPILGWTRLLQKGKLDEARRAEALNTIERNARLQSQLIEDLLDISRIMQGKLTLTAAPTSLTFVISAAVEIVRLAAEAKNIQIALDLDNTSALISGDAARLQQVVWNLLTNAVKFTPHGGRVTVELRQLNSEGSLLRNRLAQIRVIDTGKGIKPQFLPYVFEYFRQEDGSTTRKFGGLGLGLAIVRQIVEMHGGTVRAESRGENQGATFIVQLPVMQQVASIVSEPTRTQADTEAPLDNIQILLVDDDTDTREFQTFLLEQNGAKVTALASGLEALQALEQFIPDVIVSDVGMAEMDGYMLMQQIRSRPASQGGTIRAIALTAYAAELDQQRAIQAGFQMHITKPVEPEILVSKIVNLLKHNRP